MWDDFSLDSVQWDSSLLGMSQILLSVALYAFLGWIIEVVYRSFSQGRFVNAGFLKGPFVPIYGVGALAMIVMNFFIGELHLALQFLIFSVVASVVEYLTGLVTEKVLHVQLWSYDDTPLNLHGRIALPFSLMWGGLGLAITHLIHPLANSLITSIPFWPCLIITAAAIVYFVIDFSYSISLFRKLALLWNKGVKKYSIVEQKLMNHLVKEELRLGLSFSFLRKKMSKRIMNTMKESVVGLVKANRDLLVKEELQPEDIPDLQYLSYVEDILHDEEFLKTKQYKHHRNSIFDHVLKVSYLGYLIAVQKGLDARAVARGGLLHDFFLYNWRDSNDPGRPTAHFHGFRHPRIAMQNSERFNISPMERDIILKHMWPLTPAFPKYKESFLITIVDKLVSSVDILT